MRSETLRARTRILFLAIGCMLPVLLSAREIAAPKPRLRGFSVAQGLPSSETYFVHQDRKGYMWFCTDRGVARYDGYRLKVFTEQDGLTDNVVFYIYEYYKGCLWFVSSRPQLCYYENGRIVPYRYNHLISKTMGRDNAPAKDLYVDNRNDAITLNIYGLKTFRISADGKIGESWNDHLARAEVWEADGEVHADVISRKKTRLVQAGMTTISLRKNGRTSVTGSGW